MRVDLGVALRDRGPGRWRSGPARRRLRRAGSRRFPAARPAAARRASSSARRSSSAWARPNARRAANSLSPSSSSPRALAPSSRRPALARRLWRGFQFGQVLGRTGSSAAGFPLRGAAGQCAPRGPRRRSGRRCAGPARASARRSSRGRLAQRRSLAAKASSRSSWWPRDSRAWCSCWPWISTIRAASSESCARVAGRPLIQARELPSALSTRRRLHWPSSSSSCSSQPGAGRGQGGQVELGRQLGAVAAGAHQRAVGARAGQQHQRIDQQRLAGTGLAGDHGHAGTETDLGFLDHGEIAHVQRTEHAGTRRMTSRIVTGRVSYRQTVHAASVCPRAGRNLHRMPPGLIQSYRSQACSPAR